MGHKLTSTWGGKKVANRAKRTGSIVKRGTAIDSGEGKTYKTAIIKRRSVVDGAAVIAGVIKRRSAVDGTKVITAIIKRRAIINRAAD